MKRERLVRAGGVLLLSCVLAACSGKHAKTDRNDDSAANQVSLLGSNADPNANRASLNAASDDISGSRLAAVIAAIGALGTAAFSLVDATKAFGGGVSNIGLRELRYVLGRYDQALQSALGNGTEGAREWQRVVRANWINGRPRDEQKAVVKSLIRLGLNAGTAPQLAKAGGVNPDALARVAKSLAEGSALVDTDLNVLGRFDAAVDAQLEAAFNRADQLYRNASRVLAGLVAIGLAFLALPALGRCVNDWPTALLVGLLAVPTAPIAKDLASSLQAAASALRSVKK